MEARSLPRLLPYLSDHTERHRPKPREYREFGLGRVWGNGRNRGRRAGGQVEKTAQAPFGHQRATHASSLDESALDYRLFFDTIAYLPPFPASAAPVPAPPESSHWSQLCLVPWRDLHKKVHLHPSRPLWVATSSLSCCIEHRCDSAVTWAYDSKPSGAFLPLVTPGPP